MDFDHSAQVNLLAAMPPAPPRPVERGIWRTAFDSLKGAGQRMMASALELGSVVGPAVMLGTDSGNAEAFEQVKKPIDLGQTDLSKPFRDAEKRLRPDPVTAGTAEKIVYGAVGPLATLVGGAVLAGPAGIAAASGEQGFSQAEDLRQRGVDLPTRTAVGALTAGATAAGAALPLAGSTLPKTLGLYVAGGPGAFMAQQQATRSILEASDYGAIAQEYDPLDPVGLALSAIIPAPFAAWGAARNIRAPRAVAPEVTDAAMVENLTVLRDAQEAAKAEGVPAYAVETPPAPPAPDIPAPPPRRADPEQVIAARDALQRTDADPATLPADVQNLLVGLREAGQNQARADALTADFARAVEAQPERSTVDIAADVVEASREGRTVTPEPTPEALPTSPEQAAAQGLAARMAEIEQTAGDTVVRVTEDGQQVTLRDELARIRKEAAEGSDDALGADDARLLQVAANCALSTGS